jgi:hypothetical protein
MYSIPFWMGLGQEIRRKHWWNVLKYVSCLLLVFSSGLHSASKEWDTDATDYEWGPWRVIWVMTAIYKTVYCFYWDMVHDFGIWQTGYSGLRDPSTLAFPPYVYYLAMVSERRTPNRSLSLSLSLSLVLLLMPFPAPSLPPVIPSALAHQVFDLGGRISWTLTISPHILTSRWELLLSIVEISRRGIWNIFRVEHRQHQVSGEKEKQDDARAKVELALAPR